MFDMKKIPIDTITHGHPVLSKVIKYRPSGVIITAVLLSSYALQCMVNISIFCALTQLSIDIRKVDKNGKDQIVQIKEIKKSNEKSVLDRLEIRNLLQQHITKHNK